jgi:hypothetical protein
MGHQVDLSFTLDGADKVEKSQIRTVMLPEGTSVRLKKLTPNAPECKVTLIDSVKDVLTIKGCREGGILETLLKCNTKVWTVYKCNLQSDPDVILATQEGATNKRKHDEI